ncbi:MAG TPA: hypothetical protein VJ895_00245 [Candidatus Nanoarchaeia archaeon]|nr:hypothetical protein [Candidatus Nanoarchaeia archaeon]
MKKIEIIDKILLLILIVLILISIPDLIITGKSIKNTPNQYSYTKAICDNSNHCEDYVVECKGNNLIKFQPTGFAIQQPKNWTDARENRNFCDQ